MQCSLDGCKRGRAVVNSGSNIAEGLLGPGDKMSSNVGQLPGESIHTVAGY